MVGQKQMDGTLSLQASTKSRTGASHCEQLPSWQPAFWIVAFVLSYLRKKMRCVTSYIHRNQDHGAFFSSCWVPSLIPLATKTTRSASPGYLRGIFGNLAAGIFRTLVCPRTEWGVGMVKFPPSNGSVHQKVNGTLPTDP